MKYSYDNRTFCGSRSEVQEQLNYDLAKENLEDVLYF